MERFYLIKGDAELTEAEFPIWFQHRMWKMGLEVTEIDLAAVRGNIKDCLSRANFIEKYHDCPPDKLTIPFDAQKIIVALQDLKVLLGIE